MTKKSKKERAREERARKALRQRNEIAETLSRKTNVVEVIRAAFSNLAEHNLAWSGPEGFEKVKEKRDAETIH